MGDDNWDDDYTPAAPSSLPPSSSFSRGRGISAPADDAWGDSTPSYGQSNGFGGRGGGSRGGRGGCGGRGGFGGGGPRDSSGDWTCSCGYSNFASRFRCNKCSEPKPNDGGGGGRSNGYGGQSNGYNKGGSGGNDGWGSTGGGGGDAWASTGGGGGGGRSGGDRSSRPGDWTCSCGQSNFASRQKCFKCSEAKPEGAGGGNDSNSGRPGDWTCSCGQSNYASRQKCFKCFEAKPAGAEGSPFDPARPPMYVPADMDESEESIFSSGIDTGINFSKWENVEVKVSGDNPPAPIDSFKNAGLREILVKNLVKSGYIKPTPIQKYALPTALAGRDIMGCAQTGSGKTAAFLLPIMHKLIEDPGDTMCGSAVAPAVIICAPTRELVIQIKEVANKYAYGSILKICLHYGGASSAHLTRIIQRGCHILVATMGRLKDILDKGVITLEKVRFVVLDEADRMLDMGFMPDIQHLMQHTSMPDISQRQTFMFSATFPEQIQKLAGQFMKNYIFITIGIVGGASKDVTQTILNVGKNFKKNKLIEILKAADEDGVIVFAETVRNTDFLALVLSESNIKSTSIHGQRLQQEREIALRDLKLKRVKVLVASPVASRGLDLKGICHVVNYDLPKQIDEYVHRIGRTGRVGNSGRATSFFDPDIDSAIAPDLVRILEQADQPVPDFLRDAASGGRGGNFGYDNFGGVDIRHNGGGSGGHVASVVVESVGETWD